MDFQKTKNVNDQLEQFTGTTCYFRHMIPGYMYTEGVQYLAQHYMCYWLIQDIAMHSQKSLSDQPFQVWKLERVKPGSTEFRLSCEDGNYKKLFEVDILFSDFEGDVVSIWLIDKVLLLPSEY